MKGIVLAGGSGTRLYPITQGVSKQLLPIYDKPMIFYPISVLMLAGIREILLISTSEDIPNYKRLLGDGSTFGISVTYEVQNKPNGLAQAFVIGENFIGTDSVCLVLGDNIFYGQSFTKMLLEARQIVENQGKACVFGYSVSDPNRYGVAVFNSQGNVIDIEEKPEKPKSNYAVTGLYFYPNSVVKFAKNVTLSKRGEYEITSLNQQFIQKNLLEIQLLGRGFTWLDMGTHNSLLEASNFVKTIENQQGFKIACLEEIAYKEGWLSKEKMQERALLMEKNEYGNYLKRLLIS